ncbi:hypothetical protein TrVFT333_008056 [Trichoderma virens FT-333]|nr:hypothetical protein TrVFT333_008056 [Trichoderma virens FT-333]
MPATNMCTINPESTVIQPTALAPVHHYNLEAGISLDPPQLNHQTAVCTRDILTQARAQTAKVCRRKWQFFVRVTVALLSIASAYLGGFLCHDANLGIKIGAVLALSMAIFEVLEKMLYRGPARDSDSRDQILARLC